LQAIFAVVTAMVAIHIVYIDPCRNTVMMYVRSAHYIYFVNTHNIRPSVISHIDDAASHPDPIFMIMALDMIRISDAHRDSALNNVIS
jgi:hypothetical protein